MMRPPPRYRLPSDLAGALSRLDDSEIDILLVTVTSEATRRGRLPDSATTKARQTETGPALGRSSHTHANEAAPTLTLGQTNAVRAAFKAGVKPSAIARQFGISQVAVRQALGTEMRGRQR
jgi:hypothetical protein